MIISVTGYGGTGASAFIDLIKEFENVQSYKASFEFQLLQETDGILDLRQSLVNNGRRVNANAAVTRYINNLNNPRNFNILKATNGKYKALSSQYIQNLIQFSWSGRSNYDPADLRPSFDTIKLKPFNRIINGTLSRINADLSWPKKKLRYYTNIDEKDFNSITKKFLNSVFEASGFDLNKPILLEQLFNVENPLQGAEYFDDVFSLVIDRDPRDVFVLSNYLLKRLFGFMPHNGDVNTFIEYYRKIHFPKIESSRILYIRFEDLVYDYENTVNTVAEFLKLKHVNKHRYFKPEYSISNTALYKKYPQYAEDFKRITQELPEMLFPFELATQNISFSPQVERPFDKQSDVD